MSSEIWIAIITTITGIVVTYIFYKKSRKDNIKDEAIKRAKGKPKVDIAIFEVRLKEELEIDLLYIVDTEKYDSSRILYYELPLHIGNYGNKTINNIHLLYEFGAKSPLPIEDEWFHYESSLPDLDVKRKFLRTNSKITITTGLKFLNPKVRCQIGEIIALKQTDFIFKDRPIKTGGSYDLVLDFWHTAKLCISAENFEAKSFNFRIKLINSNNKKEHLDYLKDEYEKLNVHEKLHFLNKKQVIVFEPKIEVLTEKEGIELYGGKLSSEDISYVKMPKITKPNKGYK